MRDRNRSQWKLGVALQILGGLVLIVATGFGIAAVWSGGHTASALGGTSAILAFLGIAGLVGGAMLRDTY